jgi:hypothetical protein
MKYFIDNEWSYDGGVISAGVFEPIGDKQKQIVSNLVALGYALTVTIPRPTIIE